MTKVFAVMCLFLLLTACAPDPKREAEAFAIRTAAEQEALNQEQMRAQKEAADAIRLQELEIAAGHKAAVAAEWRLAMNRLIQLGSIFLVVYLFTFLFFSTHAMIVSFRVAAIGLARAQARQAMIRANLIPLDAQTRQFPMLVQRNTLLNGNVHGTLLLDEAQAPDRQMVATSGAVQYAGALAQEARQSADPAGLGMMRPAIVGAKDKDLLVGELIPLPEEARS